jgi:hypothetical protein
MRTYARLALLLAVVLALAVLADGATPAYAWSYPAPLNDAVGDWLTEFSPQVASDGLGNWVVVWSRAAPPLSGPDDDVLVARSANRRASWTPQAILNSNDTEYYDDYSPYVTTDGEGNWVAIWYSDEDIFDPNLNAYIGADYDILVARSTDNGATWTDSVALNTNADSDSGDDYDPRVATDAEGHWLAVWGSTEDLDSTIGTDDDILVARSTDNGATWTPPSLLNTNAATDSGEDRYPQVTTDGGGHWVAVWYSADSLGGTIGTDYDILVARSTDNGVTWGAPAALNTNAATDSGDDFHPQVATDSTGDWVTVWYSADDFFDPNLGANIGTDWDILMSGSTDGGATWTHPAALNTNAAMDSGLDKYPQVTIDRGLWVAVWSSTENLLDPNLNDYIGEEYDILLSSSTDRGATWTEPAALNSNATTDSGNDFDPQVTTDGAGNWVAVWSSNDDLGGTIATDRDILYATEGPAVGGIAQLPEGSGSAGRNYVVLAGLAAAAALVALGAGGWYARRRLG